jgi:hypothetical protein
MFGIKVKIIEFTDFGFPGWVRCTFTDVHGKQWFVEEKVPVVTQEYLDERSVYPADGVIAGEIEKSFFDTNDREIVTINTERPWAISAEDGTILFEVYRDQILEWDHPGMPSPIPGTLGPF